MNSFEIRRLEPQCVDDYLYFFDHHAFSDNPDWAGCYCMYYHFPGSSEEWEARSASENRQGIGQLISRGKAQGLLAYVEGEVVGWCHCAPRTSLPGLSRFRQLQIDDAYRVGSIVCFVVSPPYRRRGVASQLLDAACKTLALQGLEIAEAYPRSTKPHYDPVRVRMSDADNCTGPLNMYLRAGFEPSRELERYVIVRKPLK